MLTATVTHKTNRVIDPIAVSVTGINMDTSRRDVIEAALAGAGERWSSIFGVDVSNVENDTATVYLHRD